VERVGSNLLPLLVATVLGAAPASAQTAEDELGSWFMYFGQNRIGERSSIHTEAQIRFWETVGNYNQLLLRVGYNWDIDAKNMATGGYAFIDTEPFSDGGGSDEHRLWQQYIQRSDVGRVDFEHRFRLEERWIKDGSGTDFEARVRYRILLAINLGDREAHARSYISLYDEIFVNLQGEHFGQNRLYGAYGYRVNSRSRFEVGFLWNSFTDEDLGRLQFAYFFNPDLR
jgi:hypothetical protein